MSKVIKRISRRREFTIAEQTGGSRHTGSGALWWKKSDASDIYFQYEDKFTNNEYFSISIAILSKIEKEAISVNKIPVLRIGFITKNSTYDFVVVRKKDCSPDYVSEIYEASDKKSYRVRLSNLKDFYNRISGDILLHLFLEKKHYYIFTWDDFLRLKENIVTEGIL